MRGYASLHLVRRSTATLWFVGLFAAAAAVIGLAASGLVDFQHLDQLTPAMRSLFTPDAGPKTVHEQLVEGAGDFMHLDAGREGAGREGAREGAAREGARHFFPDAGEPRKVSGTTLKLAPGEAERLD